MLALRLTRFEHLVDLQHIAELSAVRSDDGATVAGAMTTQAAIERHAHVAAHVPLLHRVTPLRPGSRGHVLPRQRG